LLVQPFSIQYVAITDTDVDLDKDPPHGTRSFFQTKLHGHGTLITVLWIISLSQQRWHNENENIFTDKDDAELIVTRQFKEVLVEGEFLGFKYGNQQHAITCLSFYRLRL